MAETVQAFYKDYMLDIKISIILGSVITLLVLKLIYVIYQGSLSCKRYHIFAKDLKVSREERRNQEDLQLEENPYPLLQHLAV